jgi:FAD dependent oxidoreductase
MSMNRTMIAALVALSLMSGDGQATEERNVDVCVYGATPSGILAALAVRRAGKSVMIVESSRWIGGILGAGIKPLQDCPNPAATGGMTHDLLFTLGNSPEAIRNSFQDLIKDRGIDVVFEHRISEVVKDASRVTKSIYDRAPFDALGCPPAEASEKASLEVSAGMFIDASYEGDLMARAGISYRVHRESIAESGEEIAGVREPVELTPIDPFVIPGDATSGLLKWVTAQQTEPIGSADPHIQAYNYRFYVTNDPAKRARLTSPDDYDPADYELVGRYVEYLKQTCPGSAELALRLRRIFPGWMNGGEYNYHRESLITNAPVGVSHLYADGNYAEKARIWKLHQNYLRGLHHFLSTDPRVPEDFRYETAELGLELIHHPETGGWPHQLYVRLTRRLQGAYIVTTSDVYNRTSVEDPIALAQYGIDTYPSRRVWLERDGQKYVGLEGWMFVGGSKGPTKVPYAIPYRSITPLKSEAENVLVPICFSASFLGYASARMEPTFMICGEAAGMAACQALDEGVAVQNIDQRRYRVALEEAKMVLAWTDELRQKMEQDEARGMVKNVFAQLDLNRDATISQSEWDQEKVSWEWLFTKIDANQDGQLAEAEYAAFQVYKSTYPDWQARLRGE